MIVNIASTISGSLKASTDRFPLALRALLVVSIITFSPPFRILVSRAEQESEADLSEGLVPACDETIDYLIAAKELEPPFAEATLAGDTEGAEWWVEHQTILSCAWSQWEQTKDCTGLPPLVVGSQVIYPPLFQDIQRAWDHPSLRHEQQVSKHWEEILHSDSDRVFRAKSFLTLDGVVLLRQHLDALSTNGIPKRRPNAMNRNGLLLDPSIPGGVAGDKELQSFLKNLVDYIIRPLGRSLFPSFCGDTQDDNSFYAFTIQYSAEDKDKGATPNDVQLNEHSDASLYTLNLNLNLPGENYSGSSLYFVSSSKNQTKHEVVFDAGTAVLHRGMTRHGAFPLKAGKRNNLVIWLHGPDGYVRTAPYQKHEQLSVKERWSDSRLEVCDWSLS